MGILKSGASIAYLILTMGLTQTQGFFFRQQCEMNFGFPGWVCCLFWYTHQKPVVGYNRNCCLHFLILTAKACFYVDSLEIFYLLFT